jgi:hypothetical protein
MVAGSLTIICHVSKVADKEQCVQRCLLDEDSGGGADCSFHLLQGIGNRHTRRKHDASSVGRSLHYAGHSCASLEGSDDALQI